MLQNLVWQLQVGRTACERRGAEHELPTLGASYGKAKGNPVSSPSRSGLMDYAALNTCPEVQSLNRIPQLLECELPGVIVSESTASLYNSKTEGERDEEKVRSFVPVFLHRTDPLN